MPGLSRSPLWRFSAADEGLSREEFNSVLLAIAAHDMRQPLQSILSTYSWLAGRGRDERDRTYLEYGKQGVFELVSQLDALVDALSVHQRGHRVSLKAVSLNECLRTLHHCNADAASQRGLDLRIVLTREGVMSDHVLLGSILRNLVRNAIKYTPPGGRVLVGCRRIGARVRIDVCDTGPGISSEGADSIFEAFRRSHSEGTDGLGLGLFIVRRAAALLGHELELQSKPGTGSRFSIMADGANTSHWAEPNSNSGLP